MIRIILVFLFSAFVLHAQQLLQPRWQTGHVGRDAFYIDGYMVTQSRFGISVWNSQTGNLIHNITGYTDGCSIADSIIAFYVPAYSRDSVEIWNFITAEKLHAFRTQNAQLLTLDKRGKKLAYFQNDTVEVVDTHTGALQNVFNFESGRIPGYIAFSKSGDFIVLSSSEFIDILDLQQNSATFMEIPFTKDFPVDFSKAENIFYIWDESSYRMEFWDAKTKEKISTLQINQESPFVLGSPTKDNLMTFFSGSIRMWDFRNGTISKYYSGFKDFLISIGFSADSSLMIATSKSEIVVWDLQTTIPLTKLTIGKFTTNPYHSFNNAHISSDNNQIIVSLSDNNTYVVNRSDKQIVRTIKGIGNYSDIAYNKKSNEVFVAPMYDNIMQKWDALTGIPTDTMRLLSYSFWQESDCLSNDGRLVASSSIETFDLKDSLVYTIMNTSEKEVVGKIRIGMKYDYRPSVVFSEAGNKIALQTTLQTISVYDDKRKKSFDLKLNTPKRTKYTFGGSNNLICTTPDSSTIVTVWNAETGNIINTFNGVLFPKKAFNTKGDRIIINNSPLGDTTHFSIWNTYTGTLVQNINVGVSCKDVQFHPVTDIIIAWGKDNYVRAFDPNTGLLLYTLSKKAPMGFVCGNSTPVLCTMGLFNDKSYLWDAAKGNLLAEFGGHRSGISELYFSEDDHIAIAIGVEGLMSQWNLASIVATAPESNTSYQSIGTEMHLSIATDNLIVSSSQSIEQFSDYSIYNILGEKIQQGYFTHGSHSQTISLAQFGNGIYFFETSLNGKSTTQKFTIMR